MSSLHEQDGAGCLHLCDFLLDRHPRKKVVDSVFDVRRGLLVDWYGPIFVLCSRMKVEIEVLRRCGVLPVTSSNGTGKSKKDEGTRPNRVKHTD